jgi:hypothetical protein
MERDKLIECKSKKSLIDSFDFMCDKYRKIIVELFYMKDLCCDEETLEYIKREFVEARDIEIEIRANKLLNT